MKVSPSSIAKAFGLLANAAVLIGIPLFFYQQHLDAERARVLTTLSFVANFQTPEFWRLRFSLLQPWLNYEGQIAAINRAGISEPILEKLVTDIVEASRGEANMPDLRQGILSMVDFFDGLFICVQTQACDKELPIQSFEDYAREFYCLYRPIIVRYREQLALRGFGESVVFFAGGQAKCASSR
jgi:hypothetical protein